MKPCANGLIEPSVTALARAGARHGALARAEVSLDFHGPSFNC
jgi:hypothetical protein